MYPVEVTRTDFTNKDIGLENYDQAQKNGISLVFVAWSRDGKTKKGPLRLNLSYKFDIEVFMKMLKKEKTRGRCLHYEAGDRCNKFIDAHSIQNKGLLAKITNDSHVYCLSSDIGSLKRNRGRLSYEKKGIKNVSTFLGFCQKHDNELFEPIDNLPLIPTVKQIFLYSYRCLCRELFVKENALNIYVSQLRLDIKQKAVKKLLEGMEKGTRLGLKNLMNHKIKYDDALKNNKQKRIKYVLFISTKKPTVAFSGVIYPDYDFVGRQLQNLGDPSIDLELITYCSVPMDSGWGFLFAWHESNSKVCTEYMRSLASVIHEKGCMEDSLFRLVISCENHAISPQWWEKLTDENKNRIIDKTSETINVFVPTPNSYLMTGLEGLSGWKFERVISNM